MRISPGNLYKKYQTSVEKKQKETVTKGGQLKEGQTVKGEVIDSGRGHVTIKLDNGDVMSAKLLGTNHYAIGDQVSLIVEEAEGESVVLSGGEQGEKGLLDRLTTILKEADLPGTDSNISILRHMIEQKMPVDKESLRHMVRLTQKFPEASQKMLTFLQKNDLPVSERSIAQMQLLSDGEQPLLKSMANLISELSYEDISKAIVSDKGSDQLVLLDQLMSSINSDDAAVAAQKDLTKMIQLTELKSMMPVPMDTSQQDIIANEEIISNEPPIDSFKPISGEVTVGEIVMSKDLSLLEDILHKAQSDLLESGQGNGKLFPGSESTLSNVSMIQLNEWLLVQESIPESLRTFLGELKASASYRSLARSLLLSDMNVVEKSEVNRWFNETQDRLSRVLSMVGEDEATGEQVRSSVSDVRTTLDIMNGLQNAYQFLHLPLFADDQLTNAELYIMDRTKGRKDDRESLTALIRLDMLNLGQTDIYVRKTDKNVDVQFYLEDVNQLEVVRSKVHDLHNQLRSKGFNVIGVTVQSMEKSFQIMEDFFDADGKALEVNQFSFDMRA